MADITLAAAIVIHKDRVLVVRRSSSESFLPGTWGVPCGKLDQGESSRRAVLRELLEETGLTGTVEKFAGRAEFFSNWRGRPVKNVQDNYVVRPEVDPRNTDAANMPLVKTPKDDQDFKWVDRDKIDSAGLDAHNLKVIRQGLAALSRVSA